MGNSHSIRPKARSFRKQDEEQQLDEHEQDENGGQENERVQEHEQDPKQTRDQGEDHEPPSECIDEFSSFIKKEKSNLIYFMKTQYGLLEELVSNNVLTSKQVSIIQEKHSDLGQARQLLEEIARETISDEKKEAFMRALDQTKQKHASNFIRGNGKRACEYGDNWP